MPPAIRIRVKGSISHVKQAKISHSSRHKNVKKGTAVQYMCILIAENCYIIKIAEKCSYYKDTF